MIAKLTWHYAYVFLQSNLLEVPFYYLGLRKLVQSYATRSMFESEKLIYFICAVSAINSVTHPVVFFGIMNLKLTYLQNILIAESFAITTESLYFKWLLETSWVRAVAIATVANLVSWQLAPLLTYLIFG